MMLSHRWRSGSVYRRRQESSDWSTRWSIWYFITLKTQYFMWKNLLEVSKFFTICLNFCRSVWRHIFYCNPKDYFCKTFCSFLMCNKVLKVRNSRVWGISTNFCVRKWYFHCTKEKIILFSKMSFPLFQWSKYLFITEEF